MRLLDKYCGRKRGLMMIVTLTLMLLSSLTVLWMTKTLLDQQRLNKRRRELAKAHFAADAGVQLVLHWGNVPADYTPDPAMFVQGTTSPTFSKLRTQLAGGGLDISSATLSSMGVRDFNSDYNYVAERLVHLQVLNHVSTDPVNCFFKVVSTGQSLNGIKRTVTSYLGENPALNPLVLSLPAALISLADINFGGNGAIHWGEVWAKGNISGAAGSGKKGPDQWVNYRAEGAINSGAADPKFYQNVPAGKLNWPTFDYTTFKNIALAHNNYYYQKNGNFYQPGSNGADVAADPFNRSIISDELLFIDTADRQAPKADGSNLIDIQFSGNSTNNQTGIYWIGGNVSLKGQGNPPAVTGADPSGDTQSLSKIFLNGVLYAAGTLTFAGNANIYGCAVAQRGIPKFTGTADIYYNAAVAGGLPIDTGVLGSRFNVALQVN